MIYWYTGQPGHGKTLHALERVMEMKEEADAKHAAKPEKYPYRELFICNVREMQFAKIGALPLTPQDFKGWADSPEYLQKLAALEAGKHAMSKDAYAEAREQLESEPCATEQINPIFHNAIILIDEAYEHGMLPRRAPASAVPRHVERLAKHRHYGMDVIGVCQSPASQCDPFLHDLMERHIHVRRRWGTPMVHLREFHYFERNPLKAQPNVLRRVRLPKRPRGLYKSTEMDTTERSIPWYVFALGVGVPAVLGGAFFMVNRVEASITGEKTPPVATAERSVGGGENGAGATVEPPTKATSGDELRQADFVQWLTPRIPGQPWTAPAYDQLAVPNQPPRIFCMASGWDGEESCTCKTEQGTDYKVELNRCTMIARQGQYEPFLDEVLGERKRLDDVTQLRQQAQQIQRMEESRAPRPMTSTLSADQVSHYGDLGVPLAPGA